MTDKEFELNSIPYSNYGKVLLYEDGAVIPGSEHRITSMSKDFPTEFIKNCYPSALGFENISNNQFIHRDYYTKGAFFLHPQKINNGHDKGEYIIAGRIRLRREAGEDTPSRRYVQLSIFIFKKEIWIEYAASLINAIPKWLRAIPDIEHKSPQYGSFIRKIESFNANKYYPPEEKKVRAIIEQWQVKSGGFFNTTKFNNEDEFCQKLAIAIVLLPPDWRILVSVNVGFSERQPNISTQYTTDVYVNVNVNNCLESYFLNLIKGYRQYDQWQKYISSKVTEIGGWSNPTEANNNLIKVLKDLHSINLATKWEEYLEEEGGEKPEEYDPIKLDGAIFLKILDTCFQKNKYRKRTLKTLETLETFKNKRWEQDTSGKKIDNIWVEIIKEEISKNIEYSKRLEYYYLLIREFNTREIYFLNFDDLLSFLEFIFNINLINKENGKFNIKYTYNESLTKIIQYFINEETFNLLIKDHKQICSIKKINTDIFSDTCKIISEKNKKMITKGLHYLELAYSRQNNKEIGHKKIFNFSYNYKKIECNDLLSVFTKCLFFSQKREAKSETKKFWKNAIHYELKKKLLENSENSENSKNSKNSKNIINILEEETNKSYCQLYDSINTSKEFDNVRDDLKKITQEYFIEILKWVFNEINKLNKITIEERLNCLINICDIANKDLINDSKLLEKIIKSIPVIERKSILDKKQLDIFSNFFMELIKIIRKDENNYSISDFLLSYKYFFSKKEQIKDLPENFNRELSLYWLEKLEVIANIIKNVDKKYFNQFYELVLSDGLEQLQYRWMKNKEDPWLSIFLKKEIDLSLSPLQNKLAKSYGYPEASYVGILHPEVGILHPEVELPTNNKNSKKPNPADELQYRELRARCALIFWKEKSDYLSNKRYNSEPETERAFCFLYQLFKKNEALLKGYPGIKWTFYFFESLKNNSDTFMPMPNSIKKRLGLIKENKKNNFELNIAKILTNNNDKNLPLSLKENISSCKKYCNIQKRILMLDSIEANWYEMEKYNDEKLKKHLDRLLFCLSLLRLETSKNTNNNDGYCYIDKKDLKIFKFPTLEEKRTDSSILKESFDMTDRLKIFFGKNKEYQQAFIKILENIGEGNKKLNEENLHIYLSSNMDNYKLERLYK